MDFKTKIFFFLAIPIVFSFTLLIAYNAYTVDKTIKQVFLKSSVEYARNFSEVLFNYVYYSDYDRIEEILKTNSSPFVENIIVVNLEGYIIATKRKGVVLFEKYPNFHELKNLKTYKVEQVKEFNLYRIYYPISLYGELVGYLIIDVNYRHLVKFLQSSILGIVLVSLILLGIVFSVDRYVINRIYRNVDTALMLLKQIEKGNFDIPEVHTPEKEFQELFKGIKATAERLKETSISKEFYLSVINSLSEGLIIVDRFGKILEANKYIRNFLNKEVKGEKLYEVLPELYKKVFVEKKKKDRIEVKKLGKKLYFLFSATEYNDYYIITLTDITQMAIYEKKLQELSEKDALTGIYNRRGFEKFLDMEFKLARRYKRPLSLIMFDVDNFKKINDTFGHDVGDEVLKRITEIVKKNIRSTDIFARWGGEEFMILLPETPLEKAKLVAEKLRRAIEKGDFGKVGKVTASFGVTQLKDEDTPETFIKRVDQAMYLAKRKGKNRVEVIF